MTILEKKIMRGVSQRGCVYEKDIIKALCKSESTSSYGQVVLAIRRLEGLGLLVIKHLHGVSVIASMQTRH